MLGGITTTLLIGLPPLPAPPPLVKALQKVEIEASAPISPVTQVRVKPNPLFAAGIRKPVASVGLDGKARTEFGE